MQNILVIGASGFVGGNLAKKLLNDGYNVRCLARNPEKVKALASAGCDVVKGDIADAASLQTALRSIDAVYISIQTLVQQPGSPSSQGFMDIELNGLQNIVTACKANHVQRIIYVTFLGAASESPSEWVRGRWQAEQFLINSGINTTVIRPGLIVGIGGQGFNMTLANAKKRMAILIGRRQRKTRPVAIDDLVYYMIGVLNEPKSFGHCFDVGNDDVLTPHQTIDLAADVLGRSHPFKVHIPLVILRVLAPFIERIAKMPKGAMKGIVNTINVDSVGDPSAIRALLPKKLLSYKEAVKKVL